MGLKNLNPLYNDSKTGFFNAEVGSGWRSKSLVNGVKSTSIPKVYKLTSASSISSTIHLSEVTVSR